MKKYESLDLTIQRSSVLDINNYSYLSKFNIDDSITSIEIIDVLDHANDLYNGCSSIEGICLLGYSIMINKNAFSVALYKK